MDINGVNKALISHILVLGALRGSLVERNYFGAVAAVLAYATWWFSLHSSSRHPFWSRWAGASSIICVALSWLSYLADALRW